MRRIIMNTINNKILSMVLGLLLVCGLTACSDSESVWGEPYEDIDISGNISVNVLPERRTLLRNPMNGWVIYAGLGDGLSDTFWEDYDNFQSTKGRIKVSDYATTLFIRGAWSDFNPEEGRYVWDEDLNTKPAQRFKDLVSGALERNLKLAFSFIVDSRDKHYNFTPQYVMDSPGIEGYETTTGTASHVWSPYPDNAVFQKRYADFINTFAERYDDPDMVQFISGTGLGKWGESHSLRYATDDATPREDVFDWVTSLYASAFKRVPVIVNYHRTILARGDWSDDRDFPIAQRMLESAIEKGFSLRHDAFGMKSYYKAWEQNFARRYNYQRPIVAEGGWVKNSHGGSISGDGYSSYADVRRGEFDEAKGAAANMLDLRYSRDIVNGETFSWFNEAFYLVEQFIAEGGYRLYPDRISLPERVPAGASFRIGHRWHNLGWGYCPTNIPQWNDKYKVAFALLDKNDLLPQTIMVDNAPMLSEWIKGYPKGYTFSTTLTNVGPGDYYWAIGIVDVTKNNEIGIHIAAKENMTDEGWLRLSEVNVQ
ncbi:DUF4832 domain-containing protein [Sphingobacterium phlebotomi]|uniref:DUF4832 domain-containing protein n=2 Tax=Sphingobacterium phlebotomi TaxID=2605433 RepID=A0A5D4H274_9SPHI|nr:DUF4832 domain-containing protein [Sphingobacterium phlebotomi]